MEIKPKIEEITALVIILISVVVLNVLAYYNYERTNFNQIYERDYLDVAFNGKNKDNLVAKTYIRDLKGNRSDDLRENEEFKGYFLEDLKNLQKDLDIKDIDINMALWVSYAYLDINYYSYLPEEEKDLIIERVKKALKSKWYVKDVYGVGEF